MDFVIHWHESAMDLHVFPILIFLKWSEVAQSCPTLCDPMDCSLPSFSVHGIFPGKNTGMGCHFLLQEIFPTQGLNPSLLHCRQALYCLSHQGKSKCMLSTVCGSLLPKGPHESPVFLRRVKQRRACLEPQDFRWLKNPPQQLWLHSARLLCPWNSSGKRVLE